MVSGLHTPRFRVPGSRLVRLFYLGFKIEGFRIEGFRAEGFRICHLHMPGEERESKREGQRGREREREGEGEI